LEGFLTWEKEGFIDRGNEVVKLNLTLNYGLAVVLFLGVVVIFTGFWMKFANWLGECLKINVFVEWLLKKFSNKSV
jgi:hypothetical protein